MAEYFHNNIDQLIAGGWTELRCSSNKKLIEIFNLSDKEYVDTMGMNEGNHEEDDGFV